MELENDLYGMWLVDFTRRVANVLNKEHVVKVKSKYTAPSLLKPGQIQNFCYIVHTHLSYLCGLVF